ncbi:hypothetical protein BJ138DRAFT_1173294 [Hygrophoropsis aurantiaca]|uniref:Uncharacterized protein n=1 Tax=Hygrophoropsis aurantiaca TaxID=72124 RepID=A0ACB8ABT7_9AGAM|nr:hypothetical protein BJ138DRAFT_1173294 [Hygrophoropsis aurantiaca]
MMPPTNSHRVSSSPQFPMARELRQLFRGLYLTYQLFTTTLRYPLWFLLSLPGSWRPRASWSLRRSLKVRLIRHISGIILSGINDRVAIAPTTNHLAIHNDAGVKALAYPRELLNWASEPIRIPGCRVERKGVDMSVGAPFQPGDEIFYRLLDGGYRPDAFLCSVQTHVRYQVYCAFRLPCRLYLPRGFSDSAGGDLALAFMGYLVESQNEPENLLPPPLGGMVLMSPWTDMSASHETPDSSILSFIGSNTLGTDLSGSKNYPEIAFLGALGNKAAEFNYFLHLSSIRMSVDMGEGAEIGQVAYHEGPDGVYTCLPHL